MSIIIDDKEFKEKLIRNMKKEVKQIMEEAVTRKFVHEESSSITSLCGAVEACLSHGLKRRTLGLFKTSSTTALIHKVGKSFEPAAHVSRLVQEVENSDPNRRSSSSGDSTSKLVKPPLVKKNSGTLCATRYLWIRIALFEKVLNRIIDHLVQNSCKYYEKDSLVADPDYGNILSHLLIGPCTLDYSKMKTMDHFWTDPPADELVQRHRISSGHFTGPVTPPSARRPGLHYRKPVSSCVIEDGATTRSSAPVSARDYVESLHQNNKATLLYGKNNVLVQPKEHIEAMPGYMSLHQTPEGLVIKWTPNHLMNGCRADSTEDKSIYWEYALNLRVDEIVYVHCHQQSDSGGTIVLVGQDGTQYPPIHFPRGGHLLAFLSCLENGLLPHGQLDPPLWSQRGKGKVFPKLRRKARAALPRREESQEEDESTDYVFRIITALKPERLSHLEMMSPLFRGSPWLPRVPKLSSHSSSTSSSKSLSLGDSMSESAILPPTPTPTPNPSIDTPMPGSTETPLEGDGQNAAEKSSDSIQLMCDTMKHQIISRAFYGWLAHCRHLRTVRTHLAGLVNTACATPIRKQPLDENLLEGLSEEAWFSLNDKGVCVNQDAVFSRVYLGGVAHSIRKEVWPYLLGHYSFGSTEEEREEEDRKVRQSYETTMSEWLAVEAIVRQRDKEVMAMNMAKLSSGSQNGEIPLVGRDRSLSNERLEPSRTSSSARVFEPDSISMGSVDNPGTVQEEDEDPDFEGLEDDESSRAKEKERRSSKFEESEKDIDSLQEEQSKMEKMLSEESNTTDILSPTCVVTPDEGVDTERETQSGEPHINGEVNGMEDDAAADDEVKSITENGSTENRLLDDKSREDLVTENGEAKLEAMDNNTDDDGNEADAEADDEEDDEDEDEDVEADRVVGSKRGSMAENGKVCEDDDKNMDTLAVEDNQDGHSLESRSSCISPASSQGGVYSMELLDTFGLNLHRIDKDVQRCDRNYFYFTPDNLDKLRNIMCTYVWEHLETGYLQGMCDLVAPLLVIFDDEGKTYSCFCHLMKRMSANFPNGGAMDQHFANMRSLIQILDSEMFELMHQNGDYTHFYFCYRWFLLDFKRELVYDDVFIVWETIWAARHVASTHFVLFIALALVQYYRDIILDNNMDFTDIIKFFNEMAERHDAKAVLQIARNLVRQLQTLIDNK